MNLSLKNKSLEFRRCRPFLGTFVDVSVEHDNDQEAHAAIDAAFAAIERVQKLMSFHDAESEVSQLNRFAVGRNVVVSPETCQVIEIAKELYERTDGLFDIAVATELMAWELLPRHAFLPDDRDRRGRTRDIALSADGSIRFLRSLCIDLGGIAKGFAVDQAVSVLQKCGMKNGLVNAGGDMRCFGAKERSVWIRHPGVDGSFLPLPDLKNKALATSANSYPRQEGVCAHVHGLTREPMSRPFSASVCADSCVIADALTKVVLGLGEKADVILLKFNAQAFIVHSDNKIKFFEGRVR